MMVENRPVLSFLTYFVLILGAAIIVFPVYMAFVGATHDNITLTSGQMPLLPGGLLLDNIMTVLTQTPRGVAPYWQMLLNSAWMALIITAGKISVSILSAYAIVYFRFPFRMVAFWLIFITLMLPVEVRIMPSYALVADLGLLNSYAGLTVPLIASATATFLFRQFFMTVPDTLMEAARVDGAGPMKFFRDILLPLSRTNIAALCVILFIYGWIQYLWPLLITTDTTYDTVMLGLRRMATVQDGEPSWNLIMAGALLAMLPPVLIVIVMQRLFVKGLVQTES